MANQQPTVQELQALILALQAQVQALQNVLRLFKQPQLLLLLQ
jgi:hypothetical protein